MRVCIVGGRKRSEAEDEGVVTNVVNTLLDKYPQIKIVSGSCDRGTGKIVKSLCLPENGISKAKAQFDFIENHIRPYLKSMELSSSEFAELFIARNAMLDEYCEEFHLFVDEDGPRGMMADLHNRVKSRGAPCSLYKPGEQEYKKATIQ